MNGQKWRMICKESPLPRLEPPLHDRRTRFLPNQKRREAIHQGNSERKRQFSDRKTLQPVDQHDAPASGCSRMTTRLRVVLLPVAGELEGALVRRGGAR